MHAKRMSTLTIKKFPEPLLSELKKKAGAARRSLTQEVLARLEASVLACETEPFPIASYSEAEAQADAWKAVSGKWRSDLTVQEEIRQLYRARTPGRKVKL
jgi:plasmid stability protein